MTKRQAVAAQSLITSGAYRVMNAHGLLLYCCVGGVERRHHGRIVRSMNANRRWRSNGVEIGCDNCAHRKSTEQQNTTK
jgi:hypothetical protein